MIEVRRATPADTAELVRLRGIMLAAMRPGANVGTAWQERAFEVLARDLAGDRLAAFVVPAKVVPAHSEDGGGTELAACAVGAIEQRLGDETNPSGLVGYVYNVATDPRFRRRGYSRACMTALLEWYRHRGIVAIGLNATPDGEPLYASMGFRRTTDPGMRLRLGPVA